MFVLDGPAARSSTAMADELAYVGSAASADVAVIDLQTQTVLRTIAAGIGDHPQLAIAGDGSTLYARSAHRLSIVDVASRQVVADIVLDEPAHFSPSPPGIAVSPSDGRVYVASGSQVLVVDAQGGEPAIAVQADGDVGAIALSPDGRSLSFADSAVGLHAVDVATGTTIATIPVPAVAIAVSPDGQQVWATQQLPDVLTIYDRAAQRIVQRTLGALGRPVFAPDGSLVYIARPNNGVLVLDGYSARVVGFVPVPTISTELIVSPDGRCAYAAIAGGVAVVDLITREVAEQINLGGVDGGASFALAANDNRLYVADCRDGVCIVDTQTYGLVGTILRVTDIQHLAVTPDGGRALFASRWSNTGAIDLTAGDAIRRVTGPSFDTSPPSGSSAVAVAPDGRTAHVVHGATFGRGLLSTIDTATLVELRTTDLGSPSESMALSPDGAMAYVTSPWSDRVFAVETATGTVVRSLAVDGGPNSIALSPDGAMAYVVRDGTAEVAAVDLSSGATRPVELSTVGAAFKVVRDPASARAFVLAGYRVSTVDLATGRTRPLLDLDRRATGIAVSQDGSTVYVTDSVYGTYDGGGTLLWIDSATGQILGELHLSGGEPQDVALSADGAELFVLQRPGFESIMGTLARIDAAARTVDDRVSLGVSDPRQIWLVDDGSRAYISGCRRGTCVYDLRLNRLEDPLRVSAIELVFSPDGRTAFVLSSPYASESPTLSIVETASGLTTATVALPEPAYAIALDPTGRTAYAAGEQSVAVIDVSAAVVERTIPVQTGVPYDLLASASPARLIVAGGLGVAVIDLVTGSVLAATPGGFTPHRLAVSAEGASIYVSGDPDWVFEIDAATLTTLRTIEVGDHPEGLALTGESSRLLVANRGDGSVSLIRRATGEVEVTLPGGREPFAIAIAHAPPISSGTPTPTSTPTAPTLPTRTRQTKTPTRTTAPGTRTPSPTPTPICAVCDDRPCGFILCSDGVTYSRAICTQSEGPGCGCVPIDCPTPTPTVTPTFPVAPATPCGTVSPSFSGTLCGPGGEPCALLLDEPLPQNAYVFGVAIGPDQVPRILFGDNFAAFHGFYGLRDADGRWRIEATPFAIAIGSMALDPQGTVFVLADDGQGGLGEQVSLWSRDADGWRKRQPGLRGANFGADSLISGGFCLFAGANLGVDAITAYGRWQEGWSFRPLGQPNPPVPPRPVLAVSRAGNVYVLFSESEEPGDYTLRLADARGDVESIVTLPFTGLQLSQRLAVTEDALGHDLIHVLVQNRYQTDAPLDFASGDEILYARRDADGSWQTQSLARGAALSWDPCGRAPDSYYDHCTYEVETLAPIQILTNGSDVRLLYVQQRLRYDEIPQCYGPVCPNWMLSGPPEPVAGELLISVPTAVGFDTAVIASDFAADGGTAALDAAGRIHLALAAGYLKSRYAVVVPQSLVTVSPTSTSTPTPNDTPGRTPHLCVGDCSDIGSVAISDLIALVNVALGKARASTCARGIPNDVDVTVAVLIQAVNNALNGCGARPPIAR